MQSRVVASNNNLLVDSPNYEIWQSYTVLLQQTAGLDEVTNEVNVNVDADTPLIGLKFKMYDWNVCNI